MEFFDSTKPIHHRRRNLPHWEQAGCLYFLTWRLADSLPAEVVKSWKTERDCWLLSHPKPWSDEVQSAHQREFSDRMEAWLDAGHGECLLRREEFRSVVAGALHHFDGERYELDGYVIMPNHVHVLASPHEGQRLTAILQSWKGFTARKINQSLGRTGAFWMDENYDHLVRSKAQAEHYHRYLLENPSKAFLPSGSWTYWRRSSPE